MHQIPLWINSSQEFYQCPCMMKKPIFVSESIFDKLVIQIRNF